MRSQITALQHWLTTEKADGALITSPDNVFYTTGFRSNPHERWLAVYIPVHGEAILLCPGMETEDAKNAGWTGKTVGYSDTENAVEKLAAEIPARPSSLAIEKAHLTVERLEVLQSCFGALPTVSIDAALHTLRVKKSADEIALLREAARLADYAIEVGCREIAEGKTELDVLAAIEFELKKKGINEMSFSTMVLTGKNAASPHGTPGTTTFQKGDLVLFDLGVVYKGYCSDITRTVAFGELSDEQTRIYMTVLEAKEAALTLVKPGVKVSDLDKAARRVITDAGYGEYFPHRLGHGLGISVHEYPSITETNDLTLEEGMVFTIEPGIYVPGVAGVRIEDDVVVTETGFETLTLFPSVLTTV